jgi:DNA-binding NtrC family response regulator
MHVLALTTTPDAVRCLAAEPSVDTLAVETTLGAGLARVRERRWSLVLLDTAVDGGAVAELVERVAAIQPRVVVLARDCSLAVMIEALKLGAADVLPFPPEPAALHDLVTRCRAPEPPRFASRDARVARPDASAAVRAPMIAEGAEMHAVLKTVARVAGTSATVLLHGESGTGKECVARLLHEHSRRASGPFVAVNCAAMPETLLEAELFGCERGAFGGASARRVGRFERAAGGTLFLDEVGDMSLALQATILRALQEREIERVGGGRPVPLDVRVVAATHRDLAAAVRAGRFREDLYYRLAVVELRLPPLRDRGEDVATMAGYFATRFAAEHGRPVRSVADETIAVLRAHRWPGNVRQLRNVIECAVLLSDGPVLLPSHLPPGTIDAAFPAPALGASAHDGTEVLPLEDVVRGHITRALVVAGGHLGNAAVMLGIHRNTLRRKLQEYGGALDPRSDADAGEDAAPPLVGLASLPLGRAHDA